MHTESDDEVFKTLFHHARTDGESVTLPGGLRRKQWLKVNNALISRGAVRKGGAYAFHPGGCAALILSVRFAPRRRVRPPKPVPVQRSLLRLIYERLGLHMPKITVVSVPVGEPARVEEIDDTLRAMQALVGGDIEMHGLGAGITVVCNEDFVAMDLPHNGCGLRGAYFFTRNNEMGDSVSLTPAECGRVLAYVAQYRAVLHRAVAPEVHTFDSFEAMQAFKERRAREANEAN